MVEINHLVKTYGKIAAVDDLSLSMEKGKIYGLLGPNGAGKSTTMNIMTGYLGATSGTVLIDGFDIFKQAKKAKKNIGYLPELPPLYPDMTVDEYLTFVAELKGVPKKERIAEIDRVCDIAEITDVQFRLIRKLSKGYKQRVGFAQAIMGDPEVIILDEPTVGLDPIQINEFRETIRSLRDNHIVVISSHILAEISEICDHVFIISKGKLVLSDSVDHITTKFKKSQTLYVQAKGDKAKVSDTLSAIEGVKSIDVSNGREEDTISITISAAEDLDLREDVSKALAMDGFIIFEMKESEESLEDVFLELTLDEEAEEE